MRRLLLVDVQSMLMLLPLPLQQHALAG